MADTLKLYDSGFSFVLNIQYESANNPNNINNTKILYVMSNTLLNTETIIKKMSNSVAAGTPKDAYFRRNPRKKLTFCHLSRCLYYSDLMLEAKLKYGGILRN